MEKNVNKDKNDVQCLDLKVTPEASSMLHMVKQTETNIKQNITK